MKVYIVWNNADYGSTFSSDPDYIDRIYLDETRAKIRCKFLNERKKKLETKARVEERSINR